MTEPHSSAHSSDQVWENAAETKEFEIRPLDPRSQATQQRILDAAVRALIDFGYAGASTLRIQEIAAVSRGRLLHQFPSRDQLLVAAVQHLATARFEALGKRTDWPSDPAERIDAAVDTMWASYRQEYFWAAMELWMAARSNSELREALLPAERKLGEKVRLATDHMFGSDLTGRPNYPFIRELINTSMRGVAITYTFDRRPGAGETHVLDWKGQARASLLRTMSSKAPHSG